MFVLYKVRAQATVFGAIGRYLATLPWVTIARAGQVPTYNVSVVLGLRSCVAYECIPRFVLG
jgi:hypothetical protein